MADNSVGWAIVAIPDTQDIVWKYSSEKIPHMTLLFLGDQNGKLDPTRIADYIQHTVETSLRPFGMSVKSRGELGPDKADVLFFEGDRAGADWPKLARSLFLKNDDINIAYNSVPQYDKWTPHLTMGYPGQPAKPDNRDYPEFTYVRFSKIALWTGNYEGPEFDLKYPESEASEVAMTDFVDDYLMHKSFTTAKRKVLAQKGHAMPDGSYPIENAQDLKNAIRTVGLGGAAKNKIRQHIIKRAQALKATNLIPDSWNPDGSLKHSDDAENFVLEHFGVLGMHWGVRRGATDVSVSTSPGRKVRTSGGRGQSASEDAIRVARSKQIARKSSTDALSNKELQDLVTRMNLEQQYNRLTTQQSSKVKKGSDVVKGILSTVNTVNQVVQIANSPTGKLVRDTMEKKLNG